MLAKLAAARERPSVWMERTEFLASEGVGRGARFVRHADWRRLRDIWGQLSYDELGEYLREVQADLYARLKEKEEEAERLRLLAATMKWIEAMPSVHYSPLTAALRRQGEIGEQLPRRSRMLRARRAAHSCAPPQHRAAKPPIIHYRPVPVC